jgi:peptidoglycan/xylan/chitin deacetylase (PgdA/CDA1 family)
MYHGVSRYDIEEGEFEKYLKYLKGFNPISLETALSGEANSGTVLTFDDGLKNNAEKVYPLLCKYEIPAVFFVCAQLMENSRWLWNHAARQRLLVADRQAVEGVAGRIGSGGGGVEGIMRRLKGMRPEERDEAAAEIERLTPGFRPTLEEQAAFDIMSFDDARKLDPGLVTIGSHTASHQILTTLRDEELEYEVVESKRILERELNRRVEFFCYPNGDVNEKIRNLVARHYRAAVSTAEGMIRPGDDPFLLKRIPAASEIPYLVWRLYRPGA